MDQSAILLSVPGSASLISFIPSISRQPVILPSKAVFIIANSCENQDKAISAATKFNQRVTEVTIAAHALAKHFNVGPYQDQQSNKSIKITFQQILEWTGKTSKEMLEYLSNSQLFHSSPY